VKLGEGRLGAWGVGNGGEEECGEEGRASHPFIGPEGGAGRPDGERDRLAVECAINGLHTFGFWEGKGGGKRGMKTGGATPFPGEEGTPGWRARVLVAALVAALSVSRGGRRPGGAHTTVRGEGGGSWAGRRPSLGGEGGRWLGLGSGRRPKRGGGEWAGGRSHGPSGKRKGGQAETISRAEIQ
jgi:hypothetical protein